MASDIATKANASDVKTTTDGLASDIATKANAAETTTALSLKADNTNVVHLTENETIAGNKTFTGITNISGALTNNIISVVSNTTLGVGNYTVLCNATGGNFTVTLPDASSCQGRVYVIRKTDETNNTLSFSSPIHITDSSTFTSLNYPKTIRVQAIGNYWSLID
ncbi:hypothetical protein [Flavobacterium alvei]|uniref:hypothetical protein n=1 Tax=Flavobacterium alvei TaxID=2080416 RepID=UPI0026EDB780|nr:hypothetical protein [Flavobacterium alvei]